MTIFQAFFCGAVQGITEFLPVSSSAHLTVLQQFLKIPYQGKAFDIFLNMGSILATIVFFRFQIWNLLLGAKDFFVNEKTKNRYLFVTIFLSSLPVIVIFGILEIFFAIEINSLVILSSTTILFAIILYFADQSLEYKKNISRKDSILAGAVQVLSFVPGVSRLGICLSMMRYLQYSREESFKYSMILSIPPVIGACSLQLTKIFIGKIIIENWTPIAIGCFSAFMFGLISLTCVVNFLRNYTLSSIVIYRMLFGLFIIINILR